MVHVRHKLTQFLDANISIPFCTRYFRKFANFSYGIEGIWVPPPMTPRYNNATSMASAHAVSIWIRLTMFLCHIA